MTVHKGKAAVRVAPATSAYWLVVATSLCIASQGAQAANTLCASNEEIVFNCVSGIRTASVCAAHDAQGALRYVQYRFGKSQPDIAIPAISPFQRDKVRGFTSMGNHGGAEGIEFNNAEYSYIIESMWDMRSGMEDQDVTIQRNGSPYSSFSCKVTSNAIRDFVEKEQLQPWDDTPRIPGTVVSRLSTLEHSRPGRLAGERALTTSDIGIWRMERLSGGSLYDWAGFVFDRKNNGQSTVGDTAIIYLLQQDRDGNFSMLAHSAPLELRCNRGCGSDAPPFVQNISVAPGVVTISLLSQFVDGSMRCSVGVEHTFKQSGGHWQLVHSHIDRHLNPVESSSEKVIGASEIGIDYHALTGQASVTQSDSSGHARVRKLTLPITATSLESFGDDAVLKLPASDTLPGVCASVAGSSDQHNR